VKIVYIAPAYPPRIGGVEYVVKSVAERLAKAHEVTVVVSELTRAAKLVVKRLGPPQIPKTIVL
jgi:glycosyltransferase involved in cell wall biosynthesis